jgi:hypothetical protein
VECVFSYPGVLEKSRQLVEAIRDKRRSDSSSAKARQLFIGVHNVTLSVARIALESFLIAERQTIRQYVIDDACTPRRERRGQISTFNIREMELVLLNVKCLDATPFPLLHRSLTVKLNESVPEKLALRV